MSESQRGVAFCLSRSNPYVFRIWMKDVFTTLENLRRVCPEMESVPQGAFLDIVRDAPKADLGYPLLGIFIPGEDSIAIQARFPLVEEALKRRFGSDTVLSTEVEMQGG